MRLPILLVAGLMVLAPAQRRLLAQQPAKPPGNQLPFSRQENADGARFVWFVMSRTGFSYPYIPAKAFPQSHEFREVASDSARDGDVAWWPTFVAIYSAGPPPIVALPEGQIPLTRIVAERGQPRFFRKLVPR